MNTLTPQFKNANKVMLPPTNIKLNQFAKIVIKNLVHKPAKYFKMYSDTVGIIT